MPPVTAPSDQDQHAATLAPLQKAGRALRALLLDRRYFWHLVALLMLGEAILGCLIIWKIPYTKIDWPAYMQQVEGFLAGERDYSKLEGDTGPLVYPALHLYIYTAFHHFLPSVDHIKPAQYIFLGLYLLTFFLVSIIYYLSGRNIGGGVKRHFPQALLIPLTLSKRAHSIYLLRLFNDPWAMVLLYASVVALMLGGKTGWRTGSVLFSLALGVKMNILLFLPGLLVLLVQYRGIVGTIESVSVIALIQLLLPAPFFLADPYLARSYFTSAFDLSRQFLYEWTVNWRFLDEKVFVLPALGYALLLIQASILCTFATLWCRTPGGAAVVVRRALSSWSRPPFPPSCYPAYHIPLVLFTSNLIGMMTARSLHYQFHSWYFHQIPFLLYASNRGIELPLQLTFPVFWGMIEYAWSKFPSTERSSAMLLFAHFAILYGLAGQDDEISVPVEDSKSESS